MSEFTEGENLEIAKAKEEMRNMSIEDLMQMHSEAGMLLIRHARITAGVIKVEGRASEEDILVIDKIVDLYVILTKIDVKFSHVAKVMSI